MEILVETRSSLLIINKTNNCGCAPRGHYKGYKGLTGIVFYRIQSNAEARKLEFSITKEYLWDLFIKQDKVCALTGLPIHLGKTIQECTASLDRIDSSKGYVEGNLQWVDKRINLMKLDLNQDNFIELCEYVAEYNRN